MANRYSQLPLSVVEKYYPESPFLNELRAQQNIPFANQGIIQAFPNQTFNYDYLQSSPYKFNQFDKDVLREEEEDTQRSELSSYLFSASSDAENLFKE